MPEVGVPFGCGRVFPVSQGHDTGSHLQRDTWAWDFRMPVGTPIVAAADGEVRAARGDSRQGACDPRMARHANYVVVSHEGGIETQYLHFSAVVVRTGEKVRKGQLLGYSGNTGWSCGPHLHFKVAQAVGTGWNNPSTPAMIEGHGDPIRDTLVIAPACRDEDMPLRASQSLSPARVAPLADEREQAAGGIPPGAKAIVDRVTEAAAKSLQEGGEASAAHASDGSGGTREAR